MNKHKEFSEKFRKYLIKFNYQNQTYYTVSGADLTNPLEDENLSVDENNKLVLFKNIYLIKQTIENKLFLFDPQQLIPWGARIDSEMASYAAFDLDVLMSDEIHKFNDALLEAVYQVIGVVEDYAIQVQDEMLIGYLQSDLFRSFKDIAADCYLWGEKDSFDADFDYETFTSKLHNFSSYLKTRIRIYG